MLFIFSEFWLPILAITYQFFRQAFHINSICVSLMVSFIAYIGKVIKITTRFTVPLHLGVLLGVIKQIEIIIVDHRPLMAKPDLLQGAFGIELGPA
jgi:hypothetical protein